MILVADCSLLCRGGREIVIESYERREQVEGTRRKGKVGRKIMYKNYD